MPTNDPTSYVKKKDRKKHRKQRAKQGYSDQDWWNFHDYHSWVMINALEEFKSGHGYPYTEEIKSMDDWRAILDEMIEGFKASLEMSGETHDPKIQTFDEWLEPLKAKHKRGMELFTEYYQCLWD